MNCFFDVDVKGSFTDFIDHFLAEYHIVFLADFANLIYSTHTPLILYNRKETGFPIQRIYSTSNLC